MALAVYWAATFATVFPISEAAVAEARAWTSPWVWSGPPPSLATYERVLERARQSRPGPDGLPACAWRAAGPEAARLLHRCACWLASGLRLHPRSNAMAQVFAPKGDEPEDRPPESAGA